jgi:hypothetical protein
MRYGLKKVLLFQSAPVVSGGGSPPTAPSGVGYTSITSNGTGFTVTWTDNSSDETGFDIEIYSDSGFTTLVQATTASAGATSKAITGLSTYTSYWARVRAFNGAGNSSYANGAEQKTAFNANALTSATPLLWLDAAVGVTQSSNLVSAWENQITAQSGKNFVQGTGANQPLYTASRAYFNSLPGIKCADSTDFLQNDTDLNGAPYGQKMHIFAVMTATSFASGRYMFQGIGGNSGTSARFALLCTSSGGPSNSLALWIGSGAVGSGSAYTSSATLTAGSKNLIYAVFDGASTAAEVGGTSAALTTVNAFATNNTVSRFAFPQSAGGTSSLFPEYAEIIVIHGNLSSTEKGKITAYLQAKFAF